MNAFKNTYQPAVLANAKAFARALRQGGLDVAGDPAVSYTETHQVVVHVGYGRGPEIARRLEDNHIIVNYQAYPDEEGFTASGALRMGVQEMTRFGMGPEDFAELAGLLCDVVRKDAPAREEVIRLRSRFQEMRYGFGGVEARSAIEALCALF
jgi:aminomethyltransferase